MNVNHKADTSPDLSLKLDLAISPCPNDTFIFHHLIHGEAAPENLRPRAVHLEDVEELNRRAIEEQRHAVTKLSYHAMYKLQDSYRLLEPGGALGRGCGPILLSHQPGAKKDQDQDQKQDQDRLREQIKAAGRVLIPGRWTTAHLLLRLYLADLGLDLNSIHFEPTRYERIMPMLKKGEADFGVIIHEERFTFQDFGLHARRDLGDFWENRTGLPIPLGCIAVRRDLDDAIAERIAESIRESLRRARAHPESTREFVHKHAQDPREEVVRAHIDLYVNDYSLDPGAEGRRAVAALFERAREAGL